MAGFTLKLNYFLIAVVVALSLAVGVSFARDNPYLTSDYLKMKLNTIWYSLRFLALAAEDNNDEKAKDIPILIYHGVGDGGNGTSIPTSVFRDEMVALKKAGYNTVSLEDLNAFLRGEKELPAKSFVLTFDDGRKDSFYPVDPILAGLNYKAVMFVITKQSIFGENSQYYLSKRELEQLEKSGRWELASHALNGHEPGVIGPNEEKADYLSNKLWLADKNRLENEEEFSSRVNSELTESRKQIEEAFGVEVIGYAFPLGNFGYPTENFPGSKPIVTSIAKEIYPLSFYQYATEERFNSNYPQRFRKEEKGLLVKRIEVESSWRAEDLLRHVSNASGKPLPFEDDFSEDRGWIKTWGEIERRSGELFLKPVEGDTGSAAILDGSGSWKNYEFTVSVKELQGGHIYLWGRFMNDDNFVACNFGPDRVQIEQVFEGQKHVIKGELGGTLPRENFQVSIRVDDRKVGCYVNGAERAQSEFLDPSLETGGIGIKSWDPRPNTSRVLIKKVEVLSLSEAQAVEARKEGGLGKFIKGLDKLFESGPFVSPPPAAAPSSTRATSSSSTTSNYQNNSTTPGNSTSSKRNGRLRLPLLDRGGD